MSHHRRVVSRRSLPLGNTLLTKRSTISMYILHMSIAQLVVLRWFYADTADTMASQMFILTCPCDGICEDFRNQILRRT